MAKRDKTSAATVAESPQGKMLADGIEDLHPFVIGLLQELPASGSYWPPDRRTLWLATATSIFQMIYTETPPEYPAPQPND